MAAINKEIAWPPKMDFKHSNGISVIYKIKKVSSFSRERYTLSREYVYIVVGVSDQHLGF